MNSQPGRRPQQTLVMPQSNPKDIGSMTSISELRDLRRRTEEEMRRCTDSMREVFQRRHKKIEARLEYLASIRKLTSEVTSDLNDVHISHPPGSDEFKDVSMDDAILVSSPTTQRRRFSRYGDAMSPPSTSTSVRGVSTNTTSATSDNNTTHSPRRMSVKERIMAAPISPTQANRPNASGRSVRIIDTATSIRIQEQENARREAERRQKADAVAAREQKIQEHTERAAATARAETGGKQEYVEDMERRARILAFMNYRPESDEEGDYDDDDSDASELDDEAMAAMLEAEFEDGTKGQAIVDPDGLEDIIRVDPEHLLGVHQSYQLQGQRRKGQVVADDVEEDDEMDTSGS